MSAIPHNLLTLSDIEGLAPVIKTEIDIKFADSDLPDADLRFAIALYVHYLTTIVLDCTSPAKGHKARKKRTYKEVEARMADIQKTWARQHGIEIEDLLIITGAWEVADGIDDGLCTDHFHTQPDAHKPALLMIGAAMLTPPLRTNELMAMTISDWTMMDTFNDASVQLYESLER